MNKKALLIFVLSLAVFIGPLFRTASKVNSPKYNVIIIVIDALRRDHLSIYDYERETSPNIAEFARENLVFQDAYAQCSWTSPSVASLFTGLYPAVHETLCHAGSSADLLPSNIVTFAEAVKALGYRTGAFVANHAIKGRYGFNQGFDRYDRINKRWKPEAEDTNEKALSWLEDNYQSPFYLYVHYMDVHGPYRPPAPYDTAFESEKMRPLKKIETNKLKQKRFKDKNDGNNLYHYIDKYDGEILYTDHHIGEALDRIESLGLMENSVIVITSDHGEAFFEHNYCGHGHTVYNEEIRIPLIVKFPEGFSLKKEKKLLKAKVDLMDIPTTLLALLGTEFPYKTNGRNLLDIGKAAIKNHKVFSEELSPRFKGPPKLALIKGNHKAIYRVNRHEIDEMYNIKKDPEERNNIVDEDVDLVRESNGMIADHLRDSAELKKQLKLKSSCVDIDEEQRKALEALGYVQ